MSSSIHASSLLVHPTVTMSQPTTFTCSCCKQPKRVNQRAGWHGDQPVCWLCLRKDADTKPGQHKQEQGGASLTKFMRLSPRPSGAHFETYV